jgi:alcohol dehydrogenase, propanol-preferring
VPTVHCCRQLGNSNDTIGIPPGDVKLDTPIATIIVKGLKISGNLVGSLEETLESVELVRSGKVHPHIEVRPFRELPEVYEKLEKGDVPGRIVLQVGVE